MRFLAVNDAAVGQYGYPRDEFLGMTLNDLHPPEAVPSLVEVVARLDAQNPAPLWRHQLRDGRLIDMEIIAQTRALHCGGTVRFEAAAPRGTVVVVEVRLHEVPA